MATNTDLKEKLQSSPLFADVAASQLAWLLKVGQTVTLARHEFLFRRGQPCAQIYILLSGHIKLSIPVERGQEKVIEFLSPGEAFGESALLPGHHLLSDAQALEPCELLAFKSEHVRAAIARVPSFAQQLLTSLSLRFESLLRDIESASLRTAAQRVAEYLLRQPRVGNQACLPFHKRAIASKLGLQPETFSRSLQQLAADGLISVRGARILIHDPDRLQALLA
jgi:CRP-like cAMP-binding protein